MISHAWTRGGGVADFAWHHMASLTISLPSRRVCIMTHIIEESETREGVALGGNIWWMGNQFVFLGRRLGAWDAVDSRGRLSVSRFLTSSYDEKARGLEQIQWNTQRPLFWFRISAPPLTIVRFFVCGGLWVAVLQYCTHARHCRLVAEQWAVLPHGGVFEGHKGIEGGSPPRMDQEGVEWRVLM